MSRYLLVLLLCTGLLSGCASGDQDPRTGGLLGGISGLSSGTYDSRVKEREARLEQLRATQRQLDAEKGQLDQQHSAASARLQQDQAQATALQADISRLEKSTKKLAGQQGADQKRVTELQQRANKLKGKMGKQVSALDALEGSGLGDSDMDLRRTQLEKQRDALAREYELLMKMQVELAQ